MPEPSPAPSPASAPPAPSATGVWAIVVAAGSGSRFQGATPKQYLPLGEGRVLDASLAAAAAVADGVVLVVAADFVDQSEPGATTVVQGGATRSDSVRQGLAAIPPDAEVVVIHDAARPLASRALFDAVIAAIRNGADAAIPAIPVIDTIKRVHGDRVVETLVRDELVAVQTPQAFDAPALRRAHASGAEATDDAALIEAAGGKAVVVPGEATNIKITLPSDFALAELWSRPAT
jgi:2-C-methyl-D-erythritol 4-phosphate cytidylyltransferase